MTGRHMDIRTLEETLYVGAAEFERRRLLAHLKDDCADCEHFFAGLDRSDEEFIVGSYLASRGDDQTLAPDRKLAIMEKVMAETTAESGVRPSSGIFSKRARILALAACALAVAGLAIFASAPGLFTGADHTKGPSGSGDYELGLQFSVLSGTHGRDGAPRISRGINRATYSSAGSVLFRYQVAKPAVVYILRTAGAGGTELVYPVKGDEIEVLGPGLYDANDGERFLVYPLAGLSGEQQFCAVAFDESAADPIEWFKENISGN